MQCISVSHGTHLYVTDDYVCTHNTTLALSIARDAILSGNGVFFASLEMPGEQLAARFLARGLYERGLRVPYAKIERGQLTEEQARVWVDEGQQQAEWPLVIAERDVRDIGRLRIAARRAQQRLMDTPTPLGLIVVDYLQLLAVDGLTKGYERVSAASDFVKSLAMEFGVPVIALSQLSRAVEQRDPPMPNLSDLRESGKIEEDADVVMFAYRSAYYLQKKLESVRGNIEKQADLEALIESERYDLGLIIDKNRHGETRSVKVFNDLAYAFVGPDKSQISGQLI